MSERQWLLRGDPLESRRKEGQLAGFKPLRMLLLGSAGTGKSRTVRAIVKGVRTRVMKRRRHTAEEVQLSTALGAPTGCASFHMKYGARTLHRLFGFGVGRFQRLQTTNSNTYDRVQKHLSKALFHIWNAASRIGRGVVGKCLV